MWPWIPPSALNHSLTHFCQHFPLLRLPQSYNGLVHIVDGRQLWVFQPPCSQPLSFLDLQLGLHCIIIQSRLTLISFNFAVLKVKSSNKGPFPPTPFLFLHKTGLHIYLSFYLPQISLATLVKLSQSLS